MHPLSILLVAAAIELWALSPARAESLENLPTLRDATSVRAAGMAGMTRGFAGDTDAILVNPAAISATPHFSLSANLLFDPRTRHSLLLSAGAVDSKINAQEAFPLAGGFSYHYYQSGTGESARQGSLWATALSLPLYPEVLFVGTTLKYLSLSGAVSTKAVTADAAVLVKPVPFLGLSAVGYNLVEVRSAEARRAWGFGLALGKDPDFHIDLDARLDTDAQGKKVASFGAGAEYFLGGVVMPRLGYFDDRLRDARFFAGGLSFFYSGIAFEAAYRQALGGHERTLGFSVRLLDWSI